MRSLAQGFTVATCGSPSEFAPSAQGGASGFAGAVHEHANAATVIARSLLTFVLPAFLAIAGSVVACYNDVPGPQGPLPSPLREVPPQGPAPGPIVPGPMPASHVVPTLDGGLPIPAPPPQGAAAPSAQGAAPSTAQSAAPPTTQSAAPPTAQGAERSSQSVAATTSQGIAHSPARLLVPLRTSTSAARTNDRAARDPGATPPARASDNPRTDRANDNPRSDRTSDNPSSDPPPPTQPPQQAPAKPSPPTDAGIDSTADLPREVPDAGPLTTPDGGQPLNR